MDHHDERVGFHGIGDVDVAEFRIRVRGCKQSSQGSSGEPSCSETSKGRRVQDRRFWKGGRGNDLQLGLGGCVVGVLHALELRARDERGSGEATEEHGGAHFCLFLFIFLSSYIYLS